MAESKTTAEAMEELRTELRKLGQAIGAQLPLDWIRRHWLPLYLTCIAVLLILAAYLLWIGEPLSAAMLLLLPLALRWVIR